MIQKPESHFKGYIRPKLRQYGWFDQPIESGETGSGIPDDYLLKQGISIWCEFKVMHCNWPTAKHVPFQPAQWPWLHTHERHGGVSIVGVKLDNGYVFARIYDIVSGSDDRYYIKERGASVLYLTRLDMGVLDRWLLSQRQ
jgi:hypothetical protein